MESILRLKNISYERFIRLVDFFDERNELDWYHVSLNLSEEIDLDDFILRYQAKIDWRGLSKSITAPFTEEILLKYQDKFIWHESEVGNGNKYTWFQLGGLCYNKQFPFNVDFIEKVIQLIDFRTLGMNPGFRIFNPRLVFGPEECQEDYYKQFNKFNVLDTYQAYWERRPSSGVFDVYNTVGQDSIFHNSNIDFSFYNEYKEEMFNHFGKLNYNRSPFQKVVE